MNDVSDICKMIMDVGCVELPAGSFSDQDVNDILMYFYGVCQTGRDIEVIALPDCFYLYIDTPLNADRYMKMLQVKLFDLEYKLQIYHTALSNILKYLDKN